ncbi:hypothetical protein BCR44DRAFT_1437870 [Catenaria anguillulae PL171]|uniref:Uncharacterized protein n=1 Tax=Catenaria anguillulae PL171 TaxID=765915 RepID=A0A1Y2HGC9_9FUNG|nr:hypothetical protein BCR44DRAFT_1437870 [Catenaria anguillulae PL171]
MVIFGFRVLFGAFVLLMDNVVPAAVGHPILWVVFYARVAETLSSTLASLNYTRTYANLTTFLIANIMLVIAKDGGLIDDAFYFLKYRYCVFRPGLLRSESVSKIATSATTSGTTASTPVMNTSTGRLSPAASVSLESQPQQQPRPRLLTADAALRPSKLHLTRSGSSRGLQVAKLSGRLPSPNAAKAPEITTLEVHGDKIQQMQFELRLQIVRSEQMFTARLAALVGIAVPFALVNWMQVTHPDKVKLPTDPMAKQVALLVLVGIAVELAIGRAIASWLLQLKIRLLTQYDAASRVSSKSGGGKAGSRSTQGSAGTKLELWTTALPRKREYVSLVSLSTVFVCLIILGPWTT